MDKLFFAMILYLLEELFVIVRQNSFKDRLLNKSFGNFSTFFAKQEQVSYIKQFIDHLIDCLENYIIV